jgi:hypothetical protein
MLDFDRAVDAELSLGNTDRHNATFRLRSTHEIDTPAETPISLVVV